MELARYTELIKRLPYREHVYQETHKSTWLPFAKGNPRFAEFYNQIFDGNDSVVVSRGDVFYFADHDPLKAVYSTILWGYPAGYTLRISMKTRFPQFLSHADELASWLAHKKEINESEFLNKLNTLEGVGLSTFSKLLYFFNSKIEGHKCLIMDARIIQVLRRNKFKELSILSGIRDQNREAKYSTYLKVCAELSERNGYEPDQLELFLFAFGNNLKSHGFSIQR